MSAVRRAAAAADVEDAVAGADAGGVHRGLTERANLPVDDPVQGPPTLDR